MNSNFIFDCCKGLPIQQNHQGQYSTSYRSSTNKIKINKFNPIQSPKASLKTLTSVKSLKNLQTPTAAAPSQIHMTSTTDAIQQIQSFATKSIIFEKIQSPKPTRQLYLSPPVNKQIKFLPRLPSMPKQKFHFLYTDPKNPQNWVLETPLSSNRQSAPQLISPIQQQPKINTPTTQLPHPQIPKPPKGKFKRSELKKVPHFLSRKSTLTDSNLNLGQSKFTVLSNQIQQFHQFQPMILQQSAIIIDIFNPTNSQINHWKIENSPRFK